MDLCMSSWVHTYIHACIHTYMQLSIYLIPTCCVYARIHGTHFTANSLSVCLSIHSYDPSLHDFTTLSTHQPIQLTDELNK